MAFSEYTLYLLQGIFLYNAKKYFFENPIFLICKRVLYHF